MGTLTVRFYSNLVQRYNVVYLTKLQIFVKIDGEITSQRRHYCFGGLDLHEAPLQESVAMATAKDLHSNFYFLTSSHIFSGKSPNLVALSFSLSELQAKKPQGWCRIPSPPGRIGLRCRTDLAFLVKVALVRCNKQMGKCDHQILLERKMNFYVRGTSFCTLLIHFLTLILHNLSEVVIKAPCFCWYWLLVWYIECILWQVLSKIVPIKAVLSLFQNQSVKRITITRTFVSLIT